MQGDLSTIMAHNCQQITWHLPPFTRKLEFQVLEFAREPLHRLASQSTDTYVRTCPRVLKFRRNFFPHLTGGSGMEGLVAAQPGGGGACFRLPVNVQSIFPGLVGRASSPAPPSPHTHTVSQVSEQAMCLLCKERVQGLLPSSAAQQLHPQRCFVVKDWYIGNYWQMTQTLHPLRIS